MPGPALVARQGSGQNGSAADCCHAAGSPSAEAFEDKAPAGQGLQGRGPVANGHAHDPEHLQGASSDSGDSPSAPGSAFAQVRCPATSRSRWQSHRDHDLQGCNVRQDQLHGLLHQLAAPKRASLRTHACANGYVERGGGWQPRSGPHRKALQTSGARCCLPADLIYLVCSVAGVCIVPLTQLVCQAAADSARVLAGRRAAEWAPAPDADARAVTGVGCNPQCSRSSARRRQRQQHLLARPAAEAVPGEGPPPNRGGLPEVGRPVRQIVPAHAGICRAIARVPDGRAALWSGWRARRACA